MSEISKKKVKLKATIIDLVRPLLKRLEDEVNSDLTETTRQELTDSIGKLTVVIGVREGRETELIGCIGKIERQIDWGTSKSDINNRSEAENLEDEVKKLNELVQNAIEVELKATILDLVPLLKRLKVNSDLTETTRKEITECIEKLTVFIGVREGSETELFGCIGQIERHIDRWTLESNVNNKIEIKGGNTSEANNLEKKLKELNEMVQIVYKVPQEDYEKNNKDGVKGEVGASSNNGEKDDIGFKELIECMKELNPQLRDCLYSLGIFPVNEKLKKRLLIYWWIGLGLVPLQTNKNRTAEQYAEILFDDLMDQGILIPYQTKKLLHNQAVKWCTIQPTIHKQLIYACERKGLIKYDDRKEGTVHFYGDGHTDNNTTDAKVENVALLNFKQQYLDSEDIKEVFGKNRTLQVLQFGWWREVLEHEQKGKKPDAQDKISEDHIEVDEIDFLKEIGESVTYLSLRGISGVEELPKNIGKLEDLMILDLRACHNLDKLPEKPKSELGDIFKPKLPKVFKSKLQEAKWFKNLSHLDISECYLLDHMPKWICELSNLEVLKGFVAGSATRSKGHFCEIGDLSKLKKLRKLSIKMAKLSKGGTIDMKHLDKLSVLTITWKLDDWQSTSPKDENDSSRENLEKPNIESGSKSTPPKDEIDSSPKNLEKSDIKSGPKSEKISFPKNLKKPDIESEKMDIESCSKFTPPKDKIDSSRENLEKPNIESGSTSTTPKSEKKNPEKSDIESGPKSEKISFPKNLEKLDIRCCPNVELAQLIDQPTSDLKKLKRMYIRGGNLTKLIDPNPVAAWTLSIEMLRLRSLKLLQLSLTDLSKTCTKLKCVEYTKCPKVEGFPKDETCYIFARPSANTPSIANGNAEGALDDEQLSAPQIIRRPDKKAMTEQHEKEIHTAQNEKLLADAIRAH